MKKEVWISGNSNAHERLAMMLQAEQLTFWQKEATALQATLDRIHAFAEKYPGAVIELKGGSLILREPAPALAKPEAPTLPEARTIKSVKHETTREFGPIASYRVEWSDGSTTDYSADGKLVGSTKPLGKHGPRGPETVADAKEHDAMVSYGLIHTFEADKGD